MTDKELIHDNSLYLFESLISDLNKKTIKSPLASDKRPSFSVFYNSSKGTYFFKDHRDQYGDVIQYYQLKYNTDFQTAVRQLVNLLSSTDKEKLTEFKKIKKYTYEPFVTDISVSYVFKPNELEWFKSYKINVDIAREDGVSSVQYYKTRVGVEKVTMPNRLMLCYDYSKYEKGAFKIYETNPKGFVAQYQNGNHIIDGYNEIKDLPDKSIDLLLLDHSKKNYLCWKSLIDRNNLGFKVISKQSESGLIDLDMWNVIESKANRIINIRDNDITKDKNWGVSLGQSFDDMYNTESTMLPDDIAKLCGSDIADLMRYSYYNKIKIKPIIEKMIKL